MTWFRRKRDAESDARTIYNLKENEASLAAQLVHASAEAEGRISALQRELDYWRQRAKGDES